jgi:outer membrane protein assembly factor BamB
VREQAHSVKSASSIETRDASDFVPGFSQRVTSLTPRAAFSPAWVDASSPVNTVAFAIYNFQPGGWTGRPVVHTAWSVKPQIFSQLWLGVSNWDKDRWDWYSGSAAGAAELPGDSLAVYKDLQARETYVVVLLTGEVVGVLQQAWLTGLSRRGDWWMYGHDARHTSCSRFTGPASPTVQWQVAFSRRRNFGGDTGWHNNWTPMVYNTDNLLYNTIYSDVYFTSSTVYAINADGNWNWRLMLGTWNCPGVNSSPAIGDDGTVYVRTECQLHALNADASEKWQFSGHRNVSWLPAIGPEGNIYIVGFDDGPSGDNKSRFRTYLHAVDQAGVQQWEYDFGYGPSQDGFTGRGGVTAPAVANDGTVYVGCWDKQLYAFSPSGALKWTYLSGGVIGTSFLSINADPSIAKDGTVYFATDEPRLYAVHPDGTLAWSVALAGLAQGTPSIAKDGSLYVPCMDGKLYSFAPDGALRWLYGTGLSHSPATLDAAGTAYIGSADGKLYAINPNGALKWTFSAADEIWAQPTLGEDGTLHFLDISGVLNALGPGNG